jgi:DNA-binding IclR family transcriptional regulator
MLEPVKIHVGSAREVFLAEMGDDELQLLLKNTDFFKMGPDTITDKKKFTKELARVKEYGYATSFGERIPRSASISVPIRNYICPVALSILGPDNRFCLEVMLEFSKEMKESASRISTRVSDTSLGGVVK